jgi:CheY-like chemotaxis protein
MKTLLRILIVEDSEDDALLMTNQIAKNYYEVYYERVETAIKMESALREKIRDVILSDYPLPGFNGLAALTILLYQTAYCLLLKEK